MFRFCAVLLAMMSVVGVSWAADTMTEPTTGMTFVRVPAGCFQFAALSTAAAGNKAPSGKGDICLPSDIWMGAYEVTQAEYSKIMGTNPSGFKKGGRYPVERVRWFDAIQFIRKLNKASGKHFRLPSEAEWEYAARSGGKTQRYGAAGKPDQVAWYMANSKYTSHPVGEKKPNALGLYDMSGNVWEWMQDCWNEHLEAAPKDASAQTEGQCTARVLRGGSWYDAAEMITTSSRLWNDADKFDNNSGFRLILEP
ncbi:formylglycine-generating enzyme family protein [Mariprofundus ferrooxydans]|uniref:Sulfatase-modifying factor enzyme-like domain-containing protein n=1 Tax=Mariprofundus ferrooxydans PV-1 TaxID=314345 RepID=Q0F394_9PROT|nr:SUMF1/EgtB/PvdO family nonheme iron enzyme [Mariprofundus ferrooxydans]EAU56047.1 hypothetical protein SPV1_04483 [Mariprofundus ferrooxydans PV-1]KON46634.1 hypothetical protein AL013_12015 [Mariprofundus ferrooxydans]